MSNLLKKLTFSFLSFLVLFYSIAPNFLITKAQEPPTSGSWYNQRYPDWYNKVYDEQNPSEIFGERYTAAQVQWILYSLWAFILNAPLGNSPEGQAVVRCFLTNSGDLNSCSTGLKGFLGSASGTSNLAIKHDNRNLLQLVFENRSFSGIAYVKERLDRFSLVPEAQAQTPGFGFKALEPIQNMWRASRDISFGLFIIAAVVLAFMVMFRVKISPQVVISMQSAIPKLIIALILVTFSYAIAGFLIDLMYVVIGMISLVMTPMIGDNADPTTTFKLLTTGQPLGVDTANINLGFLGMGIVYMGFFAISFIVFLLVNLGAIGVYLAGTGAGILAGLSGGLLTLIVPILGVIVICTIIWHFVRIAIELIKSFAMILILTIFAPLQIVAGVVIPNLGFGNWLKSFVSSLSTFIVVGVLTLFSYIFLILAWKVGFSDVNIDIISQLLLGTVAGGLVTPSLGSASWPPLLGMGNSTYSMGLLFTLVSLVIFSLIPKAEELIQSFISGKPANYGTSIGEAIGPIGTGYFGYQAGKARQSVEAVNETTDPKAAGLARLMQGILERLAK